MDGYIFKLKEHLASPDLYKYEPNKRRELEESYNETIKKLEEVKRKGYNNLIDYAYDELYDKKVPEKVLKDYKDLYNSKLINRQ